MATQLHYIPERGSAEAHRETASYRLKNAQLELEAAKAAGKPEAQIVALTEEVDRLKEELDSLEKELSQNG